MSDISTWMRRVDEQLRKLGTAARANNTSVRNGFTEWLPLEGPASLRIGGDTADENVALVVTDTNGDVSIELGTKSDGSSYMRLPNSDGTASIFEVGSGTGVFPQATASWMPNGALPIRSLAQPRPFQVSASFSLMWSAVLSLTTDQVAVQFFRDVDGGLTADFELRAEPLNTRSGHTGSVQVVSSASGVSGTGATLGTTATIPTSIWSPAADPAGTVILLTVYGRIASGQNGVDGATIYANRPTYCV